MEGALVAVPKQRPQPAVAGTFRSVWNSPHCQWLINANTGEPMIKEDGICNNVNYDLSATHNDYIKEKHVMADGIPTSLLDDDNTEAVTCYSVFDVQKMIREDGSPFMFNLKTRKSAPAEVHFKELVHKQNASGDDAFELLMYRFQEPPGSSCVRTYVLMQDF